MNIKQLVRVFFIFLLFTETTQVIGQFITAPVQRSTNQMILEGKPYLLLEVKQGHTLYSISKAYGVSEPEIIAANPNLEGKPLSIGLVIRIPDTMEDQLTEEKEGQDRFKYHQVEPKETLFSLAKKYGITIDEIKAANPDLRRGLKAGTTIRIPKDLITLYQPDIQVDTLYEEVVEKDAVVMTEIESPCLANPYPHLNDTYKIGIILPLHIEDLDRPTVDGQPLDLKSGDVRFLEFLEGAYLAIDSMLLSGLSLQVEIIDSGKDPNRMRQLLQNGKLDHMDLIIGPVYPRELEVAAPFAQSRQIPLISPLSGFPLILENNPYAYQVNSTNDQQLNLFLEFIGMHVDHEIIILKSAQDQDDKTRQMIGQISRELRLNEPSKSPQIKLLNFDVITRSLTTQQNKKVTLSNELSRTRPNLIFIPSEDEVFVSELVNQLNQLTDRLTISVMGLPTWTEFDAIDTDALFNIGLTTYSNFFHPFVDYTKPDVLAFCQKYRMNWNSEPTPYSFQGFDITWYFLRALFYYGRNFNATLPCWEEYLGFDSFQTPMSFKAKHPGSGFRNDAIQIIRYSKEGLLKEQIHIHTGR